MTNQLSEKYPILQFKGKSWTITKEIAELLGQCEAYVHSISFTPILPEYREEMKRVAFIKGAQATTAIEGNNLSIEEIEKIKEGKSLQPSQKYQEIEVNNVLTALEALYNEVVFLGKHQLITPKLIEEFHYMIGKGLEGQLEATPGKFRNNNVTVAKYRPPDYVDVEELITNYCNWLKEEFCFECGDQRLSDIITQAIVSHVYFELIHPFGDGNGRTGRLIEYYILLRGGLPDISLHVLSNHYNKTRPEYYRQIDQITRTGKLTEFLNYALMGLRDGLVNTLEAIQLSQFKLTWHKLIYDKFAESKTGNKIVSKRRKDFLLAIPISKEFKASDVVDINATTAKLYSNISLKSIERDLSELKTLDLLRKNGSLYMANVSLVGKLIYNGKWNK